MSYLLKVYLESGGDELVDIQEDFDTLQDVDDFLQKEVFMYSDWDVELPEKFSLLGKLNRAYEFEVLAIHMDGRWFEAKEVYLQELVKKLEKSK